MLRPYLKIGEWELIFGRAVKAISSPGVCSPWLIPPQNSIKAKHFPLKMTFARGIISARLVEEVGPFARNPVLVFFKLLISKPRSF